MLFDGVGRKCRDRAVRPQRLQVALAEGFRRRQRPDADRPGRQRERGARVGGDRQGRQRDGGQRARGVDDLVFDGEPALALRIGLDARRPAFEPEIDARRGGQRAGLDRPALVFEQHALREHIAEHMAEAAWLLDGGGCGCGCGGYGGIGGVRKTGGQGGQHQRQYSGMNEAHAAVSRK